LLDVRACNLNGCLIVNCRDAGRLKTVIFVCFLFLFNVMNFSSNGATREFRLWFDVPGTELGCVKNCGAAYIRVCFFPYL
jgi:hypothetical protein